MTSEFLGWFLAQKTSRVKFRLVMKHDFERVVEKPEHVIILDNGKILIGRLTVDLDDVVEIRQ